jgi:hypothetical protein
MFIKRAIGGSKKNPIAYLQLAVSVRTENGPRHKTICTLGREDELINSGALKRFAQSISRYLNDVALLDAYYRPKSPVISTQSIH